MNRLIAIAALLLAFVGTASALAIHNPSPQPEVSITSGTAADTAVVLAQIERAAELDQTRRSDVRTSDVLRLSAKPIALGNASPVLRAGAIRYAAKHAARAGKRVLKLVF